MAISGTLLLGRYRIVKPFAKGASSVVYLAVDDVGLPYAVKLYPSHLAAHADRDYLVGRDLHHPYLNPVLARVTLENQPGVLTPFVRGNRLPEWLEREGLTRVPMVFAQLIEALAHMHERGFVHRDVKPNNLIVTEIGGLPSIKLLDYDLSGPCGEVFQNGVPGTPAYFSPEGIQGLPITPASDLYGAGVLLYWGITGQLPFDGSVQEVMNGHLNAPVVHPADVRPHGESHPMDDVAVALLSKDPKERPSAESVIGRVARFTCITY